jgi:hypothetical protein
MLARLDAPLLFVKRHSYTGIHIYDTYYKWPPGGGGIYVLENPSAPREQWKIRPVIDPTTPGTLGAGVYTHPELSWDATRLLFCFKGEPTGSTSIYEIGIDGRGLRRLTDPTPACDCYKGSLAGQHDLAPAYLPDGRIVFLSTRPSGLVPCFNTGVAILHVMNADGSDMHPISVNNVNEFDPAVLPDGRILFGRWEYVDKNALTIQSLWTVNPDGTQETALFGNNSVFPEAVLDARPVPGSHLVVGTFAKHNAPPRGTIAFIDPRRGKNSPAAITNLEHPSNPTCDVGNSCEPWPLSDDLVLFSGRPTGGEKGGRPPPSRGLTPFSPGPTRNVIEMIDRAGRRIVVLADPRICLHSPMLVKPRPRPAVIADTVDRKALTGRFFVQNIYRGLKGVRRGEVKTLRVIEETSRVSATPGGRNPYNQTFLVSAALAFSAKNYLGTVPVEEDGSAYFEVPAGRAIYLQALDADGRLIQSMRTFVQAAPGLTRSCIGCHEEKYSTAANEGRPALLGRKPLRLAPESWGSGYLDYPSMVQPVLDRHCVSCHGGPKDIAAGLDLSGGWTEHFNISYENLANRRHTQLIAHWIAGIDCMNGTALWSSQIFTPRSHGSGAAPLARLLLDGHQGRLPDLSRKERDLLLAWIDTNGLYHGTWDYTSSGCAIQDWPRTTAALADAMRSAGCQRCHGSGDRPSFFENDWINLKDPEWSRILRAPLARNGAGAGLALCRDRKVAPSRQRLHLLWKGYAHAVQPVEAFERHDFVPPDRSGEPVISFTSTSDPNYQSMLGLIRDGRARALANPRVDMPGADILPGACRQFQPPPLPETTPAPETTLTDDGVVQVAWERSARTIGLEVELHRSDKDHFTPGTRTLLTRTTLGRYTDSAAPTGKQHYALVFVSGSQRSKPACTTITVPPPAAPPAPTCLQAVPASYAVRLRWQASTARVKGYHVYRGKPGSGNLEQITREPVRLTSCSDVAAEPAVRHIYVVRAVSLRGIEGAPSERVEAAAIRVQEPVFALALDRKVRGLLHGDAVLPGRLHGRAQVAQGVLDLPQGGHVTFAHHDVFDLSQPLSLECWVWINQPGPMPVLASCGVWRQTGWFLQQIGGGWRWHVGGNDCDGGRAVSGRWVHLVGVYDGRTARLFQDGSQVGEKSGPFNTEPWAGELHVGQYSGQVAPPYQVNGRITGLKIYHRALNRAEILAASRNSPP